MSLKTHFGIEEDPIFSMIPSIRNAESSVTAPHITRHRLRKKIRNNVHGNDRERDQEVQQG